MANRLTLTQRHLVEAWRHLEAAYWREDELGKHWCIAYDASAAFERACPRIREWDRKMRMGESVYATRNRLLPSDTGEVHNDAGARRMGNKPMDRQARKMAREN